MDKAKTEIVFILDKSSSMSELRNEIVDGFNAFLEKQKKEIPYAVITTVFFSDTIDTIHKREKIIDAKPVRLEQYNPAGATALLDAIGDTIEKIKNAQDFGSPEQTIAIIITDGIENSSSKYTYKQVKALVDKMQNCSWKFIFLAANYEALMEAARIGIPMDNAVEYASDIYGTRINFRTLMSLVHFFIRTGSIKKDWTDKKDWEDDMFY